MLAVGVYPVNEPVYTNLLKGNAPPPPDPGGPGGPGGPGVVEAGP